MWVKICGNTNLEDAQLAAELGADAVGFVFAASKRQVTAEQVAEIMPYLPAQVERVGVFDTLDAEEIATVALKVGLTAVQLHSGVDEKLATQLAERFTGGVRIIQTLHWAVDRQAQAGANATSAATLTSRLGAETPTAWLTAEIARVARLGVAERVLIDSKVGTAAGGTGVAFDWDAARAAFASAPNGVHLIVAGGLRAENVAEAIARLAPWGVDVSSGVEASVGHKDPQRLAQFIHNAREAVAP
jgi:phosphoribosylanthranilate isomerase